MTLVASFIDGIDDQSRIIRRTLARYLSAASLIVFQVQTSIISINNRNKTHCVPNQFVSSHMYQQKSILRIYIYVIIDFFVTN